jgi:DNA-binding MarR family transcriptional regulator
MKKPSIPVLTCMCASFRRTSRALSQHYDESLRPLGLTNTQFSILQALSLTGEAPQGKLGRILAMDSTTLTRTLEIMCQNGWVAKRQGKDRRERRLHLASAGREQFKRALPHWEKVQTELRHRLGSDRWDEMLDLTNEVTSTVTE